MSSILKALKKAEQDSPQNERFQKMSVTPRAFFISKNPGNSPNTFEKHKNIWLSISVIFAIGFSLFLFLKMKTPLPEEKPMKAAVFESPKEQARTQSPSPHFESSSKPSENKTLISGPAPASQPRSIEKTTPALTDAPETPEQDIALPMKPKDAPDILKNQSPAHEANVSAPVSLPQEPEEDNLEEGLINETQTTDNIMELSNNDIKIQAISWSKTPEDRIAVINNKIVSETDYIQEYRIVRIHKDEIILSRSGKRYLLKFRYH